MSGVLATRSIEHLRDDQRRLWERLPGGLQRLLLWPRGGPRDAWHSFDATPWAHPWMTGENIRRFRAFSDAWLDESVLRFRSREDAGRRSYGFVANMANNLYGRACALSDRVHADVEMVLHPHDHQLMSQPAWEEYAGTLPEGVSTVEGAIQKGVTLPEVDKVFRHDVVSWAAVQPQDLLPGMRFLDLQRYGDYFCYLPTLRWLQRYDALLAVQFPYLAYLSGRPYAATQMGGDIWYECSRDDLYGRLQRRSFAGASAFMVSNPWSLAFARRYGLRNMVYMPLVMDERRYAPGAPSLRTAWAADSGGDFFVLMTARLDFRYKGSQIALRAFARLAGVRPGARLVVTGWGADRAQAGDLLQSLGIAGKVIELPVAGKKCLVEYLRSADCLVDQLSFGYYGATALEAMGCGVPVIMNLNREQYDALLPEGCPPVLQATTEDEVLGHLLDLGNSSSLRAERGRRLHAWFMRTHSGEVWAERYEAVLWGTACGQLPPLRHTPLHERLGPSERAYHAAQLAQAPVFPNYS